MRQGRTCAICGKNSGGAWGFAQALKMLGFKGMHAHPACISKEKAKAARKLASVH